MEDIAHVLYWAATHEFLLIAVASGGLTLSLMIGVARRSPLGRVNHPILIYAFAPLLLFSILNILVGSYIATALVYRSGLKGTATVTERYPTNEIVNSRRVYGYDVLIRTAGKQTISSSFTNADFNVYPQAGYVSYPAVNDVFTVHYLPDFPADFVIISNDDSPWATSLRCDSLREAGATARSKYTFDTSNSDFRTAYIAALQAIIDNKCYGDRLQDCKQEIENVEKGEK